MRGYLIQTKFKIKQNLNEVYLIWRVEMLGNLKFKNGDLWSLGIGTLKRFSQYFFLN